MRVLVPADADFPQRLTSIADPPVRLYARGNIAALHDVQSIAVIGTRRPTDYGRQAAFRVACNLASQGVTIVSGLAAGCDTAAHKGCLAVGGRTVAVLAHGLDMTYPPQNKGLAARIVEAGGCLLSAYPPGERPRKHYFVERDRLQSGLSRAVVVVETDGTEGTMHTVRFCKQQGRLLACLVHPERFASVSEVRGNQMLLGEGAFPLATADDVKALVAKMKST